jgi:hypothetical protein
LVADTDSDGSPDFIEMFEASSPVAKDTDGDGFVDKPYSGYGTNTGTGSTLVDNCPTIYNPTQVSTFGGHSAGGVQFAGGASVTTGNTGTTSAFLMDTSQNWTSTQWVGQVAVVKTTSATRTLAITSQVNDASCPAGSFCKLVGTKWQLTGGNPGNGRAYSIGTIASGQAANPNKMKLGDACNPDIDNDGLPNTVETSMAGLNAMNPDANGNHCLDGPELLTGHNPASGTSACVPLKAADLKFFRACHISLPPTGAYNGIWDSEGTPALRTAMDPGGTGAACLNGTTVKPFEDNNNDGISDTIEVEGYNLAPANKDTDGDGCQDWAQINDVNGDGIVDSSDQLVVAQRANNLIPANTASDFVLDVNKDGIVDSGDQGLLAANLCSGKGFSGGCTGSGDANDKCYKGSLY